MSACDILYCEQQNSLWKKASPPIHSTGGGHLNIACLIYKYVFIFTLKWCIIQYVSTILRWRTHVLFYQISENPMDLICLVFSFSWAFWTMRFLRTYLFVTTEVGGSWCQGPVIDYKLYVLVTSIFGSSPSSSLQTRSHLLFDLTGYQFWSTFMVMMQTLDRVSQKIIVFDVNIVFIRHSWHCELMLAFSRFIRLIRKKDIWHTSPT